MDTLSTPLSSIRHGTSRESISLLKHSSLTLPLASNSVLSFKPLNPKSKPSTVQVRPSSVSKSKTFLPPLSSSSLSSPNVVHNRAATGYAAALADATNRAGTLSEADFDARRLMGLVRGALVDPTLDKFDKAAKVIKAVQGGEFEKHVAAIIKLLVKKGEIGLIEEVIAQFSRMCDELTGTKTVVVGPSKGRFESSKLERIARDVQRSKGASRVKILHAFAA